MVMLSHQHEKSCLQFRWAYVVGLKLLWNKLGLFLAPEASQLASTSVVGGVASSAGTDGVPEITIAMAGAASVSATRPRPVSVVVVIFPAVVVLVGTTALNGASICEIYN